MIVSCNVVLGDVFPSATGTVPELDELVVRWISALGEYGVILSGVVREVEGPGGDVGLNLDMTGVSGTGTEPSGSNSDISAYTSCLILPGHDLKPS